MKAIEYVKKNGIEKSKIHLDRMKQERCINSFFNELKQIIDAFELVEKVGGLERVKSAIDGKHIGYTHFYLHSKGRYVGRDHYVDFIPDHAHHIGLFNNDINLVEQCQ